MYWEIPPPETPSCTQVSQNSVAPSRVRRKRRTYPPSPPRQRAQRRKLRLGNSPTDAQNHACKSFGSRICKEALWNRNLQRTVPRKPLKTGISFAETLFLFFLFATLHQFMCIPAKSKTHACPNQLDVSGGSPVAPITQPASPREVARPRRFRPRPSLPTRLRRLHPRTRGTRSRRCTPENRA